MICYHSKLAFGIPTSLDCEIQYMSLSKHIMVEKMVEM